VSQGNIEADLAALCERAREMGAAVAVSLPAAEVLVDNRVRLKCQVPRCVGYGAPMCPPNLMPVAEFREILACYEHTILLQVETFFVPPPPADGEEQGRLADLFRTGDYERALRARLFPRVYDLLDALEAAAFRMGYRFAAALSAGRCYICEECAREGPCQAPFRARPSMEAMGIDVVGTVERAGLAVKFSEPDSSVVYCLLLVN
jgi:predicted metal-binding protein